MTTSSVERYHASIPLLAVRHGVLLPGTIVALPIGRPRSVALVKDIEPDSIIAIGVQRDADVKEPTIADLHPIGVTARVIGVSKVARKRYRLTLATQSRLRLSGIHQFDPYPVAEGTEISDGDLTTEVELLGDKLRSLIKSVAGESGGNLASVLSEETDLTVLADRVAAGLSLPTEKTVEVLLTLDLAERLRLVIRLLQETQELSNLRKKIDREVREGLSQHQRKVILREQLKAIQRELDEGDDDEADEEETFRRRLEEADLPEHVRKAAEQQMKRLARLEGHQAEYNVVRTYLEWILDVPWNVRAEVNDDIDRVGEQLDADHYGLDDVKKLILEHMAVMQIAGNNRGNILCLAGPPGVGKTSLGQSIADATGRPFVRIALGGVRDESEIRGHRRTYVGALPGRIVHALKQAEVKNPVILLDEVDKLGRGWSGDPEAALLEVLDPEQNHTFVDHYLDLELDLSEVFFLCTANDIGKLSPPLRDRLEVIELSGYTIDEKVQIARRHLIPTQLEEHGLDDDKLQITDEGLSTIIQSYTREAGVRQLKREIVKICRALALEVARGRAKDKAAGLVEVGQDNLGDYLGREKFYSEVAERTSVPGVATGLAWTPVGGDILFIETTMMEGKGRLEITGQLGDVMQESARAALAFVRSNADKLDVDPAFLEKHDLHIHVPAGAVPKDGPSAGVTIFTALTSLLSNRRVRSDTAMTGECTLRGRVLPVGGIKAKVMAAHRAGLKRVILPARNAKDLEEVPAAALDDLEILFASDMSEVLEAALSEEGALPLAGASDDSPAISA